MTRDKKLRLRKIVSGLVFWSGLLVIGVLAVPAGILFGMIVLIWKAIDFILKKINRD